MFYNCFQQYKHNYVIGIYHITVTSLEPNFVSNPQLLDCCFNSLLRLATNNIEKRHYGLLWADPTGDWIGVLSNHHSQLHLT